MTFICRASCSSSRLCRARMPHAESLLPLLCFSAFLCLCMRMCGPGGHEDAYNMHHSVVELQSAGPHNHFHHPISVAWKTSLVLLRTVSYLIRLTLTPLQIPNRTPCCSNRKKVLHSSESFALQFKPLPKRISSTWSSGTGPIQESSYSGLRVLDFQNTRFERSVLVSISIAVYLYPLPICITALKYTVFQKLELNSALVWDSVAGAAWAVWPSQLTPIPAIASHHSVPAHL
jgi:hypothetical protein